MAAQIYDLETALEDAGLVYLPVPWDATASYRDGAADGPLAIRRASAQLDLYDPDVVEPWRAGLFMLPEDPEIREMNARARALVERVVSGDGAPGDCAAVDALGEAAHEKLTQEFAAHRAAGRLVAVVGGDHSVPLGAYRALAREVPDFGILHIDAHLDLRCAYQGFAHSHASIMYNALTELPQLRQLVQVGARDFCAEELDFAQSQGERARVFFDRDLKHRAFAGEPWARICDDVVSALPERVWISLDIDGLDPSNCPHTGTPVPGGPSYAQAVYLLARLARSGREILGFDLVEVRPAAPPPADPDALPEDEWDANVGMRLLYKLSALALASAGRAAFRTD